MYLFFLSFSKYFKLIVNIIVQLRVWIWILLKKDVLVSDLLSNLPELSNPWQANVGLLFCPGEGNCSEQSEFLQYMLFYCLTLIGSQDIHGQLVLMIVDPDREIWL